MASHKRPLEGQYGVALAVAIGALVPFLVATGADALYSKSVGRDIGASRTMLALASGLAIAGYAFGALLAGDLTQRARQRSLFLIFETVFIAGALAVATARLPIAYLSGTLLEGFATGSLLVAALPPVVRTYPANKLPITAAAIDVGFFGAVTIGPLAGALVGEGSRWRLLHTAMAAFSALVLVVAWLSLPDKEAQNKDMAFDWPAITLAFAATMLPFAATALLDSRGFGSPLVIVGLVAGLGCLVTLLMTEYAKDDPLSPVKPMWNTLPVVGVIVAMVGGGVYVAVVRLIEQFGLDVSHLSPAATGAAFWPTVLATIVASVIVGVAVKSRALAVVTAIGMITLIAGTALFLSLPRVDGVRAGIANGLLGFGAGTTVSPGLWLAAFTLPSKMVGRTLALIELVRSEADFIIAPVVLHLARSSTQVTPSGLHVALTICLSVAAVGTVAAAGLYVAGLRTLETPALAKWLDGNDGALQSTPLLARLRGIAAVSRQAPVG